MAMISPALQSSGRRLRLARLAAGLSQSELAASAGLSRQAIAGVERGSWSPSLAVALKLAEALSTTVEQLFATAAAPVEVNAEPLASPGLEPVRAQLAEVFGRWVALPLAGDGASLQGFRVATGAIHQAGATSWGGAAGRRLVIAGCDPALPLIGGALPPAQPGWELCWWSCGSSAALDLLRQGLVHAAAVHQPRSGVARLPPLGQFARIGFASWREGLLTSPELGLPGVALDDLVKARRRLVNRELGAEARSLLDHELERLSVAPASVVGYGTSATGHLAVASAIRAGLADFGIATEPVALAYSLDFSAMTQEDSVILVARDRLESAELTALLTALGRAELGRQLGTIPGYDLGRLGEEL